MSINDEISKLPVSDRIRFNKFLSELKGDRDFCEDHGIDYVNVDKEPHITRLREFAYSFYLAPKTA